LNQFHHESSARSEIGLAAYQEFGGRWLDLVLRVFEFLSDYEMFRDGLRMSMDDTIR